MDVESVRHYCLSLPHATENLQWGEDLCFKVGGKIFATVALGVLPQCMSLKCTSERFAELMEIEGTEPAPYVGRYKWILLRGLDVLPPSELKSVIRESYDMVAAKAKVASRKVPRKQTPWKGER